MRLYINTYAVHPLPVEGDHCVRGVAQQKALVLPVVRGALVKISINLKFEFSNFSLCRKMYFDRN